MGLVTVLPLVVASASLACVSTGIRGAHGLAEMTAGMRLVPTDDVVACPISVM